MPSTISPMLPIPSSSQHQNALRYSPRRKYRPSRATIRPVYTEANPFISHSSSHSLTHSWPKHRAVDCPRCHRHHSISFCGKQRQWEWFELGSRTLGYNTIVKWLGWAAFKYLVVQSGWRPFDLRSENNVDVTFDLVEKERMNISFLGLQRKRIIDEEQKGSA